jgi:hypothetical protein
MALSDWESAMRTDMKSFPIGGVLVAVVVLGYVLWDRQRNTVEIKLPRSPSRGIKSNHALTHRPEQA